MNKTKKEIYEDYKKEKAENIQLKKYLKFWLGTNDYDADISEIDELFKKTKKRVILIKKICMVLAIIFLCGSCYLLGLMWE